MATSASRNTASSLESVYGLVRERILRGELAPGLRISQVKLAADLEVSRTPLREALRLLEREGLVSAEHNRMFTVADVSLEDLDDLYALRITTEAAAIQQTVGRMSQEDIDRLVELLDEMRRREGGDIDRWQVPHREFHRRLVAGAGPRTLRLVDQLSDQSGRYVRLYGSQEPQAWSIGRGEHEALVEACRVGDPALAAERLARHLAHTVLAVFAHSAPEHQPTLVHTATRIVTKGRA